MKIRPLEAELFHSGGLTDTTKLTVAFRNFAYKKKLRGLIPRANYTDRAAAAGRRS